MISFCLIVLQASVYQTLHGVPNPYECEIGGRRMLGTSGQPIHDIARYSKLSDPLDILQHTLEWAHIAPTCPDTQCELVCFTGVMFIKVKFLLVVTLTLKSPN